MNRRLWVTTSLLAIVVLLLLWGLGAFGSGTAPVRARGVVASRQALTWRFLTPKQHDGERTTIQTKLVAETHHQIQLKNGVEAIIYPTRPRAYPGSPVDVQVEAFAPDGAPLSGRRDIEFMVVSDDNDRPPRNGSFTEDPDRPGVYTARIEPLTGMTTGDVLITMTASGRTQDPGERGSVMIVLPYTAEARLVSGPIAERGPHGLTAKLQVAANTHCPAIVRAEVQDGQGNSLGEVESEGVLDAGDNELALDLASVLTSSSPPAQLALVDVTLFAGDQLLWADAWPGRRVVAQSTDK